MFNYKFFSCKKTLLYLSEKLVEAEPVPQELNRNPKPKRKKLTRPGMKEISVKAT